MDHYEETTGKAFPGKVLLSMTGAAYGMTGDMQVFTQTPSQGAFGDAISEASALAPYQLFHLFTAAVIIEEKVFVR